MVVYLLAKPRPAKQYDEGLVHKNSYLGSQPIEITDQKRAVQLAFHFLPDLKADPKRAAELVRRDDVQREISLYHRTIAGAAEQAKERLRQFFQSIVKPTAQPAPKEQQSGLFAPDFHAELCGKFQRAGKPVPTEHQSAGAAAKLTGREAEFLRTLTRDKMARIEHPGVLPSLVKEFLGAPVAAAPAEPPAPAACERCQGSGLVGLNWETLPEAVAAVEGGAQYCGCAEGLLTHDHVEAERLRQAGKKTRRAS